MIEHNLEKILAELPEKKVYGNVKIPIEGVTFDSRLVKPGYIFVAIEGYLEDGNVYIPRALESGASVIVSSSKPAVKRDCAVVVVKDPRRALGQLSAAFYSHPSSSLDVTGVTGTNGKTTTCYLIESVLKEGGFRCGVIGTIEYRIGKHVMPASITTPQSSDLQMMFHELASDGYNAVVMEVSSHSLCLGRVEDIEFDTAIFTNLTRDHLDFHKSMEEYLKAKAGLFSKENKTKGKTAIINADDPASETMIRVAGGDVIRYGIEKDADVNARDIRLGTDSTVFMLESQREGIKEEIFLPLTGIYNVYNALAAIGVGLNHKIPCDKIALGLRKVHSIPGRFERISEGQPFTVVVDFAHTDDSLGRLLDACRQLKPKSIITVFGCGGDRDRGKRPLMGRVAVQKSDFVIVTSDNPRTEDPARIAMDVEEGIRDTKSKNYEIIIERHDAIERALAMAKAGDMVVIAGKGHETCQIFSDGKIHFDDREVARKVLKRLWKS